MAAPKSKTGFSASKKAPIYLAFGVKLYDKDPNCVPIRLIPWHPDQISDDIEVAVNPYGVIVAAWWDGGWIYCATSDETDTRFYTEDSLLQAGFLGHRLGPVPAKKLRYGPMKLFRKE